KVLLENRLLRPHDGVRERRPKRPGEDSPRAHHHARGGILSDRNLEGYVRSPARGLGVANGRPHISRIERSRRSMHAARGVSDEMLDGQVRLGGTFRHIWASGNIAISPHSNYKDLSEYRHNRWPVESSQRASLSAGRCGIFWPLPRPTTVHGIAALCSNLHHQYICGG